MEKLGKKDVGPSNAARKGSAGDMERKGRPGRKKLEPLENLGAAKSVVLTGRASSAQHDELEKAWLVARKDRPDLPLGVFMIEAACAGIRQYPQEQIEALGERLLRVEEARAEDLRQVAKVADATLGKTLGGFAAAVAEISARLGRLEAQSREAALAAEAARQAVADSSKLGEAARELARAARTFGAAVGRT